MVKRLGLGLGLGLRLLILLCVSAVQCNLETTAVENIVKYLSSSSSGHLLVNGPKNGEVFLVKDGLKIQVTDFHTTKHTAQLPQSILDAIPSEEGIHKTNRHIHPFLCAVYIDVSHGAAAFDNLARNIKASSNLWYKFSRLSLLM